MPKEKEYRVHVWGDVVTVEKVFTSNSRDCKQHMINHGADHCVITDMNGRKLVRAERGYDGTIHYVSDYD